MGIFDIIKATPELKVEYGRRRPLSPRKIRKFKKNRFKVCLMAVPGYEVEYASWREDITTFPVEFVTVNNHYRRPERDGDSWRDISPWDYSLDGAGMFDALGVDGRDATAWLAENELTLYQKFAFTYDVTGYHDYWGEYDEEVNMEIIWRGAPDVHALEQHMARSRLLALLEKRCDRWNLPREYI